MVLDFPTTDRFVEELRTQTLRRDWNFVDCPQHRKGCENVRLIRQHQPWAKIVIGGHIANVPNLAEKIGADFVVKGDGIEWFRRYLGEES